MVNRGGFSSDPWRCFVAVIACVLGPSLRIGALPIADNPQTQTDNWVLCALGDPDAAIRGCTALIESGKETTDRLSSIYNNRGSAKQSKRDLDGAFADYARAIELDPNHANAYNSRGTAKRDAGDLDGALADYTRAIELRPEYVIALNNRGNVKRGKGDLDGALADYTRAIELFPQYSSAYRNRGIVKSAQRDFPRALADFRKATDLTPSDDYDRYYTWLTRARLGQRREATRDLANVRASRKVTQGDEWSLAIAEFLVGHLNEVEFLAAAQVSDPTTTKSQLCDAYFFSGAVRLLGQDKVGARELFQNSVATGDTTNAAYTSAVAELNGLR